MRGCSFPREETHQSKLLECTKLWDSLLKCEVSCRAEYQLESVLIGEVSNGLLPGNSSHSLFLLCFDDLIVYFFRFV